jgi:hypothetical protein
MTINAPVQATIIHPQEVHDLVMNQHFSWVWGERAEAAPPTADEIWESARTAFSEKSVTVTFMLAVTMQGHKFIDFIDTIVTGVSYESGAEGMLNIELNTEDKRWTKISGFYSCRQGTKSSSGWLKLTPRRG